MHPSHPVGHLATQTPVACDNVGACFYCKSTGARPQQLAKRLRVQDGVRKDQQLQEWALDLATTGGVAGMDASLDSLADLVSVLTTVIFICGPQHCAVNYTQVRALPR